MGDELAHAEIIATYLKAGDTITHTRCMGCVEEHIYTGLDGRWLCGYPTRDTMRLDGQKGNPHHFDVNDIAPNNVTHINRVPVDAVPFVLDLRAQRPAVRP